MAKKVLLAMDESENAMRAAEFLAQNFSSDHEVTIFSVVLDTQTVCEMNSPTLIPYFNAQKDAFCHVEDQKKMMIQEAQQKAREKIIGAGFSEKNIHIKIESKKKGIAKGILDEANSGYDLVVMGRHGVAGIGDFLLGSTPQKILSSLNKGAVLLVS